MRRSISQDATHTGKKKKKGNREGHRRTRAFWMTRQTTTAKIDTASATTENQRSWLRRFRCTISLSFLLSFTFSGVIKTAHSPQVTSQKEACREWRETQTFPGIAKLALQKLVVEVADAARHCQRWLCLPATRVRRTRLRLLHVCVHLLAHLSAKLVNKSLELTELLGDRFCRCRSLHRNKPDKQKK